jgi:hypothetical protein
MSLLLFCHGRLLAVAQTPHIAPWDLATKYYTAPLELHVLPHAEWQRRGELASDAVRGAEALILVLDASAPSWESLLGELAAWAQLASERDIGTLLCVGNKYELATGRVPGGVGGEALPGGGVPAGSVSALMLADWCADAGFEFVPTTATAPLAGSEGRDKEGLARVYEPPPPPSFAEALQHLHAAGDGGAAAAHAATSSSSSTADRYLRVSKAALSARPAPVTATSQSLQSTSTGASSHGLHGGGAPVLAGAEEPW